MKINFVERTNHPISFREIGVGTCFVLDAERHYRQGIQNAYVYMKIPSCSPMNDNDGYDSSEPPINAVNLNLGVMRFVEDDDEIILIPATLNAEAL